MGCSGVICLSFDPSNEGEITRLLEGAENGLTQDTVWWVRGSYSMDLERENYWETHRLCEAVGLALASAGFTDVRHALFGPKALGQANYSAFFVKGPEDIKTISAALSRAVAEVDLMPLAEHVCKIQDRNGNVSPSPWLQPETIVDKFKGIEQVYRKLVADEIGVVMFAV
jgi:hypothetical protein